MMEAYFSSPIVEALGWALLHSLWQGALLAFLLALLLLLMRTFSSHTRYLIVALFLGLFVATLPVNFFRLYEPDVQQAVISAEKEYSSASTALDSPVRKQVPSSPNLAERISDRFADYFEEHLPLLVTLWWMGIVILLLRYLGQLAYVQRLKHYGTVPFSSQWKETISRLERKLNLTKKVSYLESLRIPTPLTIGWLKPVVLFPLGLVTRLSASQVEAILLHELAHIKRNDYLFNIIQSMAVILLFYHPAVYWMSRLLDQERENYCDDLVVQLTGEHEHYASMLIHLQELKLQPMKTSLSVSGPSSSFSGRILRLLNNSLPAASQFREGFVTALILIVGLSLLTAAAIQSSPVPSLQTVAGQTNFREDDKAKVDLLIQAIDDRDERLFNYLLSQGADINGISSEGWTPLGFAAAEGRLQFAIKLLEKGAKVDLPLNDRKTPLLAAAAEGHLEIVKLLIEKGASTKSEIDIQTALTLAAREGHMDVVQFLMPLSPKLSDADKVELLINAIDENHKQLFDFFLNQGVDINGVNREGWTPLGNAAEEGRTALVQLLIDKGAKINYPLDEDRMPYLAAAREGHLEIIKILLAAGVDVNTSSENGTHALSVAAREGHIQIVDFLLSKGVQLNKANEAGWTALHYAASDRQTMIMKKLIAAGTNIEMPVTSEWVSLSGREGRRVIMHNWTPLIIAIEEEHIEGVKVLIDARANVNVRVNKTVYAIEGEYKQGKYKKGELLYQATGWTPLMEAVEKQNVQLVKLLIASGADINAQTPEGISVRGIAGKLGNKEILQLLK